MNQSTRQTLLKKAQIPTALLAIFSGLALIPGLIRGLSFLKDAKDHIIDPKNLLGIGNRRIPGTSYMIVEPYLSMILLILAVAIPLLILLILIGKLVRLGKEELVGRGLYWFIILCALAFIPLALGLYGRLLNGNGPSPIALTLDPLALMGTLLALCSIVLAIIAIVYLSKSMNAPETLIAPLVRDKTPIAERPLDASSKQEETAPKLFETAPIAEERIPLDASATKEVSVTASPTQEVPAVAASPTKEVPVAEETVALPIEEVTVRRIILAYPGEPEKVILITQEYQGSICTGERAEIRLKKEFRKKKAQTP
ncbi:hypothetical protein ABB02_00109 [Clostridiaceae bacterium JG1575]|nr:hypothetical protein ABB02_00109 [Clostridiaceae bacterium JG1575]